MSARELPELPEIEVTREELELGKRQVLSLLKEAMATARALILDAKASDTARANAMKFALDLSKAGPFALGLSAEAGKEEQERQQRAAREALEELARLGREHGVTQ